MIILDSEPWPQPLLQRLRPRLRRCRVVERKIAELFVPGWPHWGRGPSLAWSPDGRWLVAAGSRGPDERNTLLRTSPATGEMCPLVSLPPNMSQLMAPAVSPDGRTLAFSRLVAWGRSELCLMALGDDLLPAGEVRRLETGSSWNASPAWLPDRVVTLKRTQGAHAAVPALAGLLDPTNVPCQERHLAFPAWHYEAAAGVWPPGSEGRVKDFRQLKVWKKAHHLTLEIYRVTASFPRSETYGITAQVRRASSSIGANLAEGCGRDGDAELARFCAIARGSASELEYHLLLARDLHLLPVPDHDQLAQETTDIKRMLTALMQKLNAES